MLAGEAAFGGIGRQIEAKQAEINSWNDVLVKQQQVAQAANAEADRTQAAADAAAKNGPAPGKSETRESLLAQRKQLEDALTGKAMLKNPLMAPGELLMENISGSREAMQKAFKDVNYKLHVSDLDGAASKAKDDAKGEADRYNQLKDQIQGTIVPKLQHDILQGQNEAATVLLQTKAANEAIDNGHNAKNRELKRKRRDADLDIDIGEAVEDGDEPKAGRLRAKKKWLQKYDELQDLGEPEWQARRGANVASAEKDVPGGRASARHEPEGIANNIVAARAASQNADQGKCCDAMLSEMREIKSEVRDMKAKWASTPVKVQVQFS